MILGCIVYFICCLVVYVIVIFFLYLKIHFFTYTKLYFSIFSNYQKILIYAIKRYLYNLSNLLYILNGFCGLSSTELRMLMQII